jgi:hypothetical protein
MEERVERYVELDRELLEKVKSDFGEVEPREAGNLTRSMAVGKGIGISYG